MTRIYIHKSYKEASLSYNECNYYVVPGDLAPSIISIALHKTVFLSLPFNPFYSDGFSHT